MVLIVRKFFSGIKKGQWIKLIVCTSLECLRLPNNKESRVDILFERLRVNYPLLSVTL